MDAPTELRVFVSSTFRDLTEEREHLVKKIFPELRALCRDRGVTLIEVDLRWGITEEEQRKGSVLRICLEEVDRCRPWFVGILGTRYGWIPTRAEVADPLLLEAYPWIEEAIEAAQSITEIEVRSYLEGHPAGSAGSGLFYRLRSGGSTEPGVERLANRISDAGYSVREFTDAAELGRLVRCDLGALIEREYAPATSLSHFERERRAQSVFSMSRLHGYVELPVPTGWFEEWSAEGGPPLLITAPSGLGKSAFAAWLANRCGERYPSSFVHLHHVGATDQSASLTGLIRSLLESICVAFSLTDTFPESPEELESALPTWLFRLGHLAGRSGAPALIVFDAVDQLEERARTLEWLPRRLPAELRLVVTARDGSVADQIATRGFLRRELPSLDDRYTRGAIVSQYLGGFRKRVAQQELDRIIECEGGSSPLFLRVLAEELRLHGKHETIAAVVDYYTAACDAGELFELVLERMERDYGRSEIEATLGLLSASRNGLAENELLELTGCGRLELSRILVALDFHLIRRESRLGFFHDHLRVAASRRYTSIGESLRTRHIQIAEYLERAEIDDERRVEAPWQWLHAQAADRLVASLCDRRTFPLLNRAQVRHELIGYWRTVDGLVDPIEAYLGVLRTMRGDGISATERATMVAEVGSFAIAISRIDAAEQLLSVVHSYRRRTLGTDDLSTAHAADLLATARYHAARYAECERLWFECLGTVERREGTESPTLCGILDSLATCAMHRGDLDAVDRHTRRSLDIARRAYGDDHPGLIDRLINAGEAGMLQKRHTEAVVYLEQATRIALRGYGEVHPTTVRCRTELGHALRDAGQIDEAIDILRTVAENSERVLGEHINLARTLEVLGTTLIAAGRPSDALGHYERAHHIRSRLQGVDHPDTMFSLSRIALALRRLGRARDAELIVRELLPRQLRICGHRDSNVMNTILILINILRMTGRDDEASLWQRRHDAADATID